MVLPRGVDKATGLRVALDELKLPLDALVAVGMAKMTSRCSRSPDAAPR